MLEWIISCIFDICMYVNMYFLKKQGSKEIEERSPEKEKRKAKLRGDERKERKMNRKRVSVTGATIHSVFDFICN